MEDAAVAAGLSNRKGVLSGEFFLSKIPIVRGTSVRWSLFMREGRVSSPRRLTPTRATPQHDDVVGLCCRTFRSLAFNVLQWFPSLCMSGLSSTTWVTAASGMYRVQREAWIRTLTLFVSFPHRRKRF